MELQMLNRETERFYSLGKVTHGMYDIFKPHKNCTDPTVVLLEGELGKGKSVFCQKLANDWSEGKTGESFPSFQIFLKLQCSQIKSDGAINADILKKSIMNQLLPENAPQEMKTRLFEYVKEQESQVLVVLDGLHELNQAIDIFSLIVKELHPWKCKFLLTSRNDPNLRKHCDSLFQIIGFTIEDAKSFIRKFFGETDQKIAEDLINRINESSQVGKTLLELVYNPLITSFICYICKSGNLSSARTLLQEITCCILRRYYAEKQEDPPQDPLEECKEDLAALGRLAMGMLKNGQEQVAESEIPNEIHMTKIMEYGFLSKIAIYTGFKRSISYQFLHKTFLYFFAASIISAADLHTLDQGTQDKIMPFRDS